jgi:hypothetical protein
VWVLLPGDRWLAYAVSNAGSPPGRRRVPGGRQPYAVYIDNNLGSNREYLRELCHALRPLVELTRLRHVRFRAELAAGETLSRQAANVVSAGV